MKISEDWKILITNLLWVAFAFILMVVLGTGFVFAFSDKFKIYKCVDTFGNTVYCEKVKIYDEDHLMYGTTKDGTVLQIVQYKIESSIKGKD